MEEKSEVQNNTENYEDIDIEKKPKKVKKKIPRSEKQIKAFALARQRLAEKRAKLKRDKKDKEIEDYLKSKEKEDHVDVKEQEVKEQEVESHEVVEKPKSKTRPHLSKPKSIKSKKKKKKVVIEEYSESESSSEEVVIKRVKKPKKPKKVKLEEPMYQYEEDYSEEEDDLYETKYSYH